MLDATPRPRSPSPNGGASPGGPKGARLGPGPRGAPAFPTLDRAFDAVERALAALGIGDPGTLRSPRPVEEALSPTALPPGTLLVLDASELEAVHADIRETVADERAGGAMFCSIGPDVLPPWAARVLRDLASSVPTYAFSPRLPLPSGLGKARGVLRPPALSPYGFLVADTPGFRVAVVTRALPGGGFVGLWSGDPHVLAELTGRLRAEARAAGHAVPAPAPDVPALDGVESAADVWAQAEELRAFRVVREAQLREIARAAALRGVAIRRDREARKQAG
jgi:hypothetical protein